MTVYNTKNIDSKTTFLPSEKVFIGSNIPISNAGYYKIIKNDVHSGDHDMIRISLTKLYKK